MLRSIACSRRLAGIVLACVALSSACAPITPVTPSDPPPGTSSQREAGPRPAAATAGMPAAAPASIRIDRDDAPLPPQLRAVLDGRTGVDFLLLGEIHDHPMHHRLRARWLEALAAGQRFVIALEQLDADRQPALDAARARQGSIAAGGASGSPPGADARRGSRSGDEAEDPARQLAQAAGFDFRGWHWPFYAPYFELALRLDLPLVAANLSNEQARSIARGQAHPLAAARPAGWKGADDDAMAAEIREGHCGMLPERVIAPMAEAQRARDARIARALVEARRSSGLPVVLIAGNGHVRVDLGVPRHLRELAPGARVFAVGFVEDAPSVPAYDLGIVTPVHARSDPCEAMRPAKR